MIFRILILFMILQFGESCNSSSVNQIDCEHEVIISSNDYAKAPDDQLELNQLEINGDCLYINFSSSGCDGSTWELKLLDSEDILYSDPPQRKIRLSLKNEEPCDAYFSKEISFDIHDLQVDEDQVILNMKDWSEPILYQY